MKLLSSGWVLVAAKEHDREVARAARGGAEQLVPCCGSIARMPMQRRSSRQEQASSPSLSPCLALSQNPTERLPNQSARLSPLKPPSSLAQELRNWHACRALISELNE